MFTTSNYEEVKAELERRGMWDKVQSQLTDEFKVTICIPRLREVIYVQKTPPLAAWGQYDNDQQYLEVAENFTVKRWNPATTVRPFYGRLTPVSSADEAIAAGDCEEVAWNPKAKGPE